ncbi:MAG: prephenate dehydrogenase [Clostridia bacterium]|nr:prephenate dehydrogenase [Clostridia bacterium]
MIIAIYGLGLIGGSLGRAIIKKTSHKVLGFDIDKATMLKANMLNAYHEEINDNNIKNADLVVLALTPAVAIKTMREVAPMLKDNAIVIDCCGNKRKIVEEMDALLEKYPKLNFSGVHPMAGREFSGISHSTAGLFEHAFVIMTPVHTPIDALVKVKQLFLELGCEGIEISTAIHHDEMIAYTSQLAHIVSSSFVKSSHSAEHVGFSAGSFKDMTRVAKLNPDMWTELLMDNRDNLLREIEELQKHIEEFKTALSDKDENKLNELLSEGAIMKEIAENARKERKRDE